MKLVKKILNREGILYDDYIPNAIGFKLPGAFLYQDMPPICYEIAFKHGMRRSKNTHGFLSDEYVLEASCSIYPPHEGDYTCLIFRKKKSKCYTRQNK